MAAPSAEYLPVVKKAEGEGTLAETDYYFNSYSHYGIHMEMLKDRHRTESYRDAILRNPQMFEGKYVLDVGCGTAILSLFAAKAGAKHVVAIDCSSIAVQARDIVKENGYEDVITIMQGKVEDLALPTDVPHIDIIISEWMGYFLLYESMLNTVLFARDKWGNKETGCALLPDKANMYVCGVTDEMYKNTKFDVWNHVAGFDFSYFKRLQYVEPIVDTVLPRQIVTDCQTLVNFDLGTVTEADLSFESRFTLTAMKDETIHALSVHFDTPFTAGHDAVTLDTSPWGVATHWRQTVLYLYNEIRVVRGDTVECFLRCKPNTGNPRDLDIHVTVKCDGKVAGVDFEQDFRLR